MIRALAFCAVVFAVQAATAQTVQPTIIHTAPEPELGIRIPELAPVSACGKHECPAGDVAMAAEKPADNHTLLKQKLAEMNCLQSEIDALRLATGTPQQILVKLKVLEVSRSKLQTLGADITALNGHEKVDSAQWNSFINRTTKSTEFSATDDSEALFELIDVLQQNNVAKVLAEPSMAIVCGRPASFNVGGELPLPATPGAKNSIEFKSFGTEVNVLATALGDDRVRLDLRAKVSEVDHGKAIEVAGVKVPAINVRQVNATIELAFGQTGELSGMIERRHESIKRDNKIATQVNEIETMFLITTEAIGPIGPGETNAGTPYRTANSASDASPAERSLRVSKPYTPR